MIGYIFSLIITGLIVGALARLLIPGRNPMSIVMTILLGIGGSLIAGMIVRAFTDRPAAGIFFSVIVSAVLVYFYSRSQRGRSGLGSGTSSRRRTLV